MIQGIINVMIHQVDKMNLEDLVIPCLERVVNAINTNDTDYLEDMQSVADVNIISKYLDLLKGDKNVG